MERKIFQFNRFALETETEEKNNGLVHPESLCKKILCNSICVFKDMQVLDEREKLETVRPLNLYRLIFKYEIYKIGNGRKVNRIKLISLRIMVIIKTIKIFVTNSIPHP